jgi:hypothetical protein
MDKENKVIKMGQCIRGIFRKELKVEEECING